MKKFLTRKVGGFMVTLELLISIVAWSYFMSGAVWIINTQLEQKYIYNAFISSTMLTSKWGGTNSNLYHVNGKSGDISDNMQRLVRSISPGQNVYIRCTPAKVTKGDETISSQISWRDKAWSYAPISSMTTMNHNLTVNFTSVVKSGILL